MKQEVSLREANQHLSRYVEAVERGDEIIITRRGKPVAKLVKFDQKRKLSPEQRSALERMLSVGWNLGIAWNGREEIYEERVPRRYRR